MLCRWGPVAAERAHCSVGNPLRCFLQHFCEMIDFKICQCKSMRYPVFGDAAEPLLPCFWLRIEAPSTVGGL